jgi:hypothetical protein
VDNQRVGIRFLTGATDSPLIHNILIGFGPTQPPIQWVRVGSFSEGVKPQEHIADHSPPSSAKVKNDEAVPPLPHSSSWYSA